MVKMTDQLVRLAAAGASIELKAASKMTDQFVRIAGALQPGATLRIIGADAKMTDQLARIAHAAPGQVIFTFTD